MCTETYIDALPRPREPVTPHRATPARWLALLRMDTVQVTIGLTAVHPLPRRRITLKRTARNIYRTNYLFFSPDTSLAVQLPDGVTAVPPGAMVWMPPGVPYALYRGEMNGKGMLYRLRFDVIEDDARYSPWQTCTITEGCSWFPDLYGRIAAERGSDDPFTGEYARSLIAQLSIMLFRTVPERQDAHQGITPARLRQVRTFFMEHITERPAPADLAACAGLSPAYFTKVFTRDVGISPRQWMTGERIRYGAELLRGSSMNVSETAEWLGYTDLRLFIRQFRAVLGVTPGGYRKK